MEDFFRGAGKIQSFILGGLSSIHHASLSKSGRLYFYICLCKSLNLIIMQNIVPNKVRTQGGIFHQINKCTGTFIRHTRVGISLPTSLNNLFGDILQNFCNDNNLEIVDKGVLPPDTYSYVSSAEQISKVTGPPKKITDQDLVLTNVDTEVPVDHFTRSLQCKVK